jgi:hypothetical protein
MTIKDVIETTVEELGLAKSLSIPGGGNLEYVLEEVWIDGTSESEFRGADSICHTKGHIRRV